MAKYRKKPIVIEAEVYQPGMEDGFDENGPFIKTLEGKQYVLTEGDWIITGIKGERYPCKPDIFKATYDLVEDPTHG